MPPQKYNLKILEVKDLTADVKEFTLEKPEGADFLPGQFMTIKINDGGEGVCMRSYSVLLSPDGKNLQLCIKLVENGRGTGWLFGRQTGEELEVLFPAGRFVLPETLAKKLVFIGTGTGLVPLLCMLESFPEGFSNELELIFGVRFNSDIYYDDRLSQLETKLPSFKKIITLSKPEDSWEGYKGRVTDYLNEPNKEAQYFLCGNGVMLKDACAKLEEQGVPKENIFHENFG